MKRSVFEGVFPYTLQPLHLGNIGTVVEMKVPENDFGDCIDRHDTRRKRTFRVRWQIYTRFRGQKIAIGFSRVEGDEEDVRGKLKIRGDILIIEIVRCDKYRRGVDVEAEGRKY